MSKKQLARSAVVEILIAALITFAVMIVLSFLVAALLAIAVGLSR